MREGQILTAHSGCGGHVLARRNRPMEIVAILALVLNAIYTFAYLYFSFRQG